MKHPLQHPTSTFSLKLPHCTFPLFATAMLAWLIVIATMPAMAQTFTVLHTFTGGADGGNPVKGLTMDRAGNLYGTAQNGGLGYGTVFELARQGSGWVMKSLYQFHGYDGAGPQARLVFGPDGSLYGTTVD